MKVARSAAGKRSLEPLMPEVIARYERGESCATIGKALGFGGQSIHKRLVKAGVTRRTWVDPFVGREREVETRYRSGETPVQIAEMFGCSRDAVVALLNRRDVALRSYAEAQRITTYVRPGRPVCAARARLNPDDIVAHYVREGCSVAQTAAAFMTAAHFVNAILRRAGMMRTRYETERLQARDGVIRRRGKLTARRAEIIERYVDEKLSLSRIGAVTGVTASGVRYILVRERIRLRGLSESISASWSAERKEAERQRMLGRPSPSKGLSWTHPYRSKPWTVGDKNPSWKGGITPLNALLRSGPQSRRFRRAVLARDNYTCVFCGARARRGKPVELHVDHIKRWSDYPELRFEMTNGRTLCAPCHQKTPTYGLYDRTGAGERTTKKHYVKRFAQLRLLL